MSDLPEDVIELLQQVRHADYDDYPSHLAVQATQLLEDHGVPTKTTEEVLRERIGELEREVGTLRRKVEQHKDERKHVTEVNQRYGATINELNAKVRSAQAAAVAAQTELERIKLEHGIPKEK